MLQTTDHLDRETAAAQGDPARYLVSLELSRSTWLVTTLAPDSEKLSRHQIEGGDAAGLLALLDRMRTETERRLGRAVQIVTIQEAGLDGFAEAQRAPCHARKRGRPSLPPGRYFRLHLIGYFEGIDSERGLEWRCADSLSLRAFLRLGTTEPVPDHSWLSKTRSRLPREVHEAVFTCQLR